MNSIRTLREVFSKKNNVLIAVVATLFFYSINIVVSSWMAFTEFSSDKSVIGTMKLFSFLFFKIGGVQTLYSSISLILMSILFGILFSLVFYKIKMNIPVGKKAGTLGVIGIFIATFVPGCAACGVGLLPLLGLGTGILYLLPFEKTILSTLSILILCFAISRTSENLYTCKMSNSFEEMKKG